MPFLRPQTATNRVRGFCLILSGTFPNFLFVRHGAKRGASDFFAAHSVNHQPDSQRKKPAKCIALAEVLDIDFHDNLFSLSYDAMFTYSLFTFWPNILKTGAYSIYYLVEAALRFFLTG